MMNYFFSRHQAMEEMVEAVGGFKEQFKGSISRVRREGEDIVFTEFSPEGKEPPRESRIPANSTVVLVGPLPLQESFLRAGVKTLLVPQNRRVTDENGKVTFVFSGLLQVHKIEVVTTQWIGRGKTEEENVRERQNLK